MVEKAHWLFLDSQWSVQTLGFPNLSVGGNSKVASLLRFRIAPRYRCRVPRLIAECRRGSSGSSLEVSMENVSVHDPTVGTMAHTNRSDEKSEGNGRCRQLTTIPYSSERILGYSPAFNDVPGGHYIRAEGYRASADRFRATDQSM